MAKVCFVPGSGTLAAYLSGEIDHHAAIDLRRQIDALDTTLLELLSKRMEITNEIGIYKKQHNMPVLQTGRYNEIISRLVSRCAGTGLDPDFIKKIFEIIHSQSVANQLKL